MSKPMSMSNCSLLCSPASSWSCCAARVSQKMSSSRQGCGSCCRRCQRMCSMAICSPRLQVFKYSVSSQPGWGDDWLMFLYYLSNLIFQPGWLSSAAESGSLLLHLLCVQKLFFFPLMTLILTVQSSNSHSRPAAALEQRAQCLVVG